MSLNQLKIGMRLAIGFGAVLLFLALFSLLSVVNLGNLAEQTDRLYKYSFSLTGALLRIDANVAKLGQAAEDIQNEQNTEQVNQALKQVADYKALIEEDFDLALERYLGDKKDIEASRKDYLAWATSLDQVLVLVQDHSREIALREARKRTIAEREVLSKRILWTTDFGENLAKNLVEDLKTDTDADAAQVAEKIYRHPFAVGRAILRIDGNIGNIRIAGHQMRAVENSEEKAALEKQIKVYEAAIETDFNLIMERFLGDKNEIAKTQEVYKSWLEMVKHETSLVLDDSREKALDGLKRTAAGQRATLDKSLAESIQAARNRAEAFVENAGQVKSESIGFTYLVLILALAVSLVVALWIARSIVVPLGRAVNLSRELAEGKLSTRVEVGGGRDETSQLLRAMNEMANDLQAVISETRAALIQLAEGNKRAEIKGQFIGDFIEIKNALQITAQRLADATEKNEIETWLKTGQAQLNEAVSGDQTLKQLAENAINFFTPYLKAQVGALYLIEQEGIGEPQLRLVATHAYTWRKNANTVYQIGEGVVGQAAYEGKPFVIGQAPEDHMLIDSGLGESAPRAILVMPFKYEGQLKGVMELASLENFSQLQLEFLAQSMPILAISINTAESRTRMKVLLEQTQAQSEELQQQQAALQQSNEELQSQSEELQSQQEELRQINEELEERTRELERQQKEVEEKNDELEKAKSVVQAKAEELELASKYKSEFLANMSHELRTPLNSLLILSQMLSENKKGNLDDKQVEYARTIHHSGADLLTLINDILDLSKVEAGRIEIHPEDVRLDAITTSLDQKFRHMAEQKGLQFHINLAGNLPATVHIDEQRVRQILTNLLGNSFKFTHEGGITLDISRPETGVDLSRSGLDPKRTIAYSVSDTGIGIAKEKQKVIFEAFQQADGSVNRKYGGTGLGLSISRQLVNLLGGEIQLHSEPGKGSRFSVYLPERMRAVEEVEAEKPAARPAPAPAPKAKSGEARGKEKTVALEQAETPPIHDDRDKLKTGDKSILIIEDDRGFSNILVELGREKQFKCLLAEDGRAGLELAEKYQPSAIMLDLGLPLVDGWTVMERLKDNPQTRHIPVHFVSGADYSIDARRMGAIGYSLKPVSMAELGEAFKKIESFVSKAVKNLLIVTDDKKRQKAIEELVKGMDAAPTLAHTRATAWKELNLKTFDCLVLDVDTEQGKGVELLEQMHNTTGLSQVPVVIYAERELSETEHALIQKCTANVTIKEAYSGERLLDEATLFLHQVESKLPQEKQKILRKARDKEGVLAGKKVLLVDDDARNVFALSAALEEKGMEVLAAANGKEALEVLDEHPETDVVLMDIMMPEMDGYEATKRIRGKLSFNKLPIIALTAKAMKGDKAKCIEAGANDYLPKPVEPARLLSLLRVWLAK